MVTRSQKLYFFLLIAIVLLGLLLFKEIKEGIDIVVRPTQAPLLSPDLTPFYTSPEDPVFGNPGTDLSIVEFNDLACKECQKTHALLLAFVEAHPKDAHLTWKSLPQTHLFLKEDRLALEAASCVPKTMFWKFIDRAMQNRAAREESGLKKIARDLKIDETAWWKCTTDDKTTQRLTAQITIAQSLQITTPPTIFINNKKVTLSKDTNLTDLLTSLIQK